MNKEKNKLIYKYIINMYKTKDLEKEYNLKYDLIKKELDKRK